MLKFSRISALRKRLQMDSKSDLTTNGIIWHFFGWNLSRFVDFKSALTEICKKCSSLMTQIPIVGLLHSITEINCVIFFNELFRSMHVCVRFYVEDLPYCNVIETFAMGF